MIDENAHNSGGWLRLVATDLDQIREALPRSFDSAYGNGRQIAVCDLVEAVERVGRWHIETLKEASFHSQDRCNSAGSAFRARTWSSAAVALSTVSLDLTRAVEFTSYLAELQVRAQALAHAFEKHARDAVDGALADARSGLDQAVQTMRSGADALACERPLSAPDPAALLAPTAPARGPESERQEAALFRSAATAPDAGTTPTARQPNPTGPVTASASARGRR
ncbi:hypothetical protein [Kitasatospora griseola]|uniref:hypothetical protein n=1 Tax=Kitasatospora griseola TaxID=2064 RepID=UPI00382FC076